MNWYTLDHLQFEAMRLKRKVCAWRPDNLSDLEGRYVWDKEGNFEPYSLPSPHSIKVTIDPSKNPNTSIVYPDGHVEHSHGPIGEAPAEKPSDQVQELVTGGDRRKTPEKASYRSLTLEEVKALEPGDHVWFLANDGTARRVKVNGRVKTWKRDPDRLEVPCKYGLRECYTFTRSDIHRLLKRLSD